MPDETPSSDAVPEAEKVESIPEKIETPAAPIAVPTVKLATTVASKPVAKPTLVVSPKESEKDKLHKQITEILVKYNMIESDIPVTHDYWELLNKYRHLNRG
jgi:hypothetical protein